MHRFIIEKGAVPGDCVQLEPSEAHHALRVLRLMPGAGIQLSDGRGRLFGALIDRVEGPNVFARIVDELDGGEPPIRVTLYQGLPKFDKLELICQKATELGVMGIVPVKTSRAVVKLSQQDGEKRRERMQRICVEAAKQSGRAAVPQVFSPVTWQVALEQMKGEALMLMPWEEARGRSMADMKAMHPDACEIGIFIGPEGGISADEAADAQRAGALPITLGPRILRTETAAIASLAMAMQLWGDL